MRMQLKPGARAVPASLRHQRDAIANYIAATHDLSPIEEQGLCLSPSLVKFWSKLLESEPLLPTGPIVFVNDLGKDQAQLRIEAIVRVLSAAYDARSAFKKLPLLSLNDLKVKRQDLLKHLKNNKKFLKSNRHFLGDDLADNFLKLNDQAIFQTSFALENSYATNNPTLPGQLNRTDAIHIYVLRHVHIAMRQYFKNPMHAECAALAAHVLGLKPMCRQAVIGHTKKLSPDGKTPPIRRLISLNF